MGNLVSIFQTDKQLPADKIPSWMKADEPSTIAGGLLGNSRNRIGLKGNRFRLIQKGEETAKKDEPYLDVVIVAANEHVSRIYYKDKFDPDVKSAPDCFSADGLTPFKSVANKQSDTCATCKQNVKGSAVTEDKMKKTKACSYSKRIVVWLVGDETKTLYQMDLKSMSIFGDGVPSKGLYTLSGYANLLAAKKIKAEAVVTRISFDDESSVPKLYFTPQAFIKTKAEFEAIAELSQSDEAKELATVDVATMAPDVGGTTTEVKKEPEDETAGLLEEIESEPAPEAKPKKAAAKKEATKKEPAKKETKAEPEAMDDDSILEELDDLLPTE